MKAYVFNADIYCETCRAWTFSRDMAFELAKYGDMEIVKHDEYVRHRQRNPIDSLDAEAKRQAGGDMLACQDVKPGEGGETGDGH